MPSDLACVQHFHWSSGSKHLALPWFKVLHLKPFYKVLRYLCTFCLGAPASQETCGKQLHWPCGNTLGKGSALRDICPFLPKEPQKDQTELQIQKQGFLSSSSDQKLFQKKTQSNSGSRIEKKGLYRHSYCCPLTLADKSCKLGFRQQLRGFQGCSKTSLPRFVGNLCLPLSKLLHMVSPIPSCWD